MSFIMRDRNIKRRDKGKGGKKIIGGVVSNGSHFPIRVQNRGQVKEWVSILG